MGRWWTRTLLMLVLGLTALSFIVVWPSEPDRYLPDAIPWPEGKGFKVKVPTIRGGTFGVTTLERRAMSLGLDLRGGTRLVLEPEPGFVVDDLDSALDGARDVIERRVNAFGVAETEVATLGTGNNKRISVQLPGISPEEATEKIGRTALLQFCEPIVDGTGGVAVVPEGSTVTYASQSCEPLSAADAEGNVDAQFSRNDEGAIAVESEAVEFVPWSGTTDREVMVWQPVRGELDGVTTELTGELLEPNTFVDRRTSPANPVGLPFLVFSWNSDGSDLSEQATERLSQGQLPLAPFLDGEPIRGEDGQIIAPSVQSVITSQGSISGLSVNDAQELSILLNTGAFPIPLIVVQQQDVDASLGETAVKNSVIAGGIALLLIMLFMILYYRLPGVVAAMALVIYTAFLLAIFKIWPVTLTLAGVAAFILSIGMAIDANILIFERLKEELRLGRNLVVAMDDGFNRAWSSIRDSNISTLITSAILYWFGNQFAEAAIKGFAITLAIGVLVSMFSAITVSRTLMRVLISFRPIARRTWLFMPDVPDRPEREARQAPAPIAGGGEER